MPTFAPNAESAVASPCISVCVMDEATGWCTGCLRTLDEIALWGMLDNDDKHAVLAAVAARRDLGGARQA